MRLSWIFQSTCPARGTTALVVTVCGAGRYFNPRAPRGARPHQKESLPQRIPSFQSTCPARGTTALKNFSARRHARFQSTCPARGTTVRPALLWRLMTHFNPRAPRGARRQGHMISRNSNFISIHVPREGHDAMAGLPKGINADISIHVPREGHDETETVNFWQSIEFQSTCPARGTTADFMLLAPDDNISIHVPREGHDTTLTAGESRMMTISIHVPREGHDGRCISGRQQRRHFNPRAPRGARPNICQPFFCTTLFQSTCPARGTTWTAKNAALSQSISIHVPREGHDQLTSISPD